MSYSQKLYLFCKTFDLNFSYINDSVFFLTFLVLLGLLETIMFDQGTFASAISTKYIESAINYYSYDASDLIFLSNSDKYNISIIKSYGPLTLDINNIKYDSYIFIIPAINEVNKPFFLAINCRDSLFNVKANNQWNGWFMPFFNYENKILDDFCSNSNNLNFLKYNLLRHDIYPLS